jgi:hypothetical protein
VPVQEFFPREFMKSIIPRGACLVKDETFHPFVKQKKKKKKKKKKNLTFLTWPNFLEG